MTRWITILLHLLICANIHANDCSGTDSGLSFTNTLDLVTSLGQRYPNCSRIIGNLEINQLKKAHLERSDVQSIDHLFEELTEITGYLLIHRSDLTSISFPKLEVIHGDTLFRVGGDASVFIQGNRYLQSINMPKLRVISSGTVLIKDNQQLCYKIDWTQMFNEPVHERLSNKTQLSPACQYMRCSDNCYKPNCWGDQPDMCQIIYRDSCAPQCSNPSMRQCYKSRDSSACCHSSCAGGCTGPLPTECHLCARFSNNGTCVDFCPKRKIYDHVSRERVVNPEGKYTYSRQCVTECPDQMDVYDDMCLTSCPPNHFVDRKKDNLCLPCDGPCPKTCEVPKRGEVHAVLDKTWINDLANCTSLAGPLIINMASRISPPPNSMQMNLEDLEILSSLKEITGYIDIQSVTFKQPLTSLGFLRNVENIHGKTLKESRWAVFITGMDRNFQELGLVSLRDKSILSGSVFINSNPGLCFTPSHTKLFNKPEQKMRINKNRPIKDCVKDGLVCDNNCFTQDGCWGIGPGQCFTCIHYKLNKTCVNSCPPSDSLYLENDQKTCSPCNIQCSQCLGPGAGDNCTTCANVRLDGECVQQCPSTHYNTNGTCMPCSISCYDLGCTGPSNRLGPGGCTQCNYGVVTGATVTRCLHDKGTSEHAVCKSNGLTNHFINAPGAWGTAVRKYVCVQCDPVCETCTGKGKEVLNHGCICKDYTVHTRNQQTNETVDVCAADCPVDYFESSMDDCNACHLECRDGCSGPHSTNCSQCLNFKVLNAPIGFVCLPQCPIDKPFEDQSICTTIDLKSLRLQSQRKRTITISTTIGILALLLLVFATLAYFFRKKARAYEIFDRLFKLNTAEMEPNHDAKPNMSKLMIISGNDLRRGRRLGSGAFGVVYQAVWTVKDKDGQKRQLPVAIKELLDMSPSAQKEALNEAAVMASLRHAHLLPLAGVCISDTLMMVTPLMLLGNLLDYVRNNQSTIGSLHLLTWISQIASAMTYLEEHRYVHRDLAARNVLVRTPGIVMVTDFGLAKMIDYGKKEVFVDGRVPVKWLAIECIRYHRFTHKSDVWAFGVTAWELLNFGQKKPYGDTPITQIPTLLESGDKLAQPPCASLDVYTILLSCWFFDPDSRPNFVELWELFSDMCKDPARYLSIENDRLRRGPPCGAEDPQGTLAAMWGNVDSSLPPMGDYFDSGMTTPSTPASPSSPSKPLMSLVNGARRRPMADRNLSTGSYRYQQSPFKPVSGDPVGGTSSSYKSCDSHGLATDDDNYLVPDRVIGRADFSSFYPDPEPYTPIVLESASPNKPPYYNIVQPTLKPKPVPGPAMSNDGYIAQVETETTV